MQFRAPDNGQKTRLKHVERPTEIKKLRKAASCWLYSENILAMRGNMNVKKTLQEVKAFPEMFQCNVFKKKINVTF